MNTTSTVPRPRDKAKVENGVLVAERWILASLRNHTAWLALNVMAHNVARWVSRLGLGEVLVTTKRLRRRTFSVPGSLTRSGRQIFLHLPSHWPWGAAFLEALKRLRLIRTPLLT
jgi:hypothetical protein